jgi:hypothetical protein
VLPACQREEVLKRISALGIKQLYLPALTNTKPDEPHVPILAPRAEILRTRKRVIVLINDDTHQDLGVLAYRELQRDGGINGGSIVNFLKDIVTRNEVDVDVIQKFAKDGAGVEADDQVPGVIVLNTAQLLYSHKFNKALSNRSWIALPRKSIIHDPVRVHPVENYVKGHSTPQEHIRSVFDSVITNAAFVAPNAEVYVVAIQNGVEALLDVLNQDFWKYGGRITAMAIVHSEMRNAQITDPALKAFLHMRTRHWKAVGPDFMDCTQCHSLPADYKPQRTTPQSESLNQVEWLKPSEPRELDEYNPEENAHQLYANSSYYVEPTEAQPDDPSKTSKDPFITDTDPVCPTFPGGDTNVGECIFTQRAMQQMIIGFFEQVAQDPKNFCNPVFQLDIPEPTPENPLTISASDAATAAASSFKTLPPEMLSPEQQTLTATKAALHNLKTALLATPFTSELEPGRQHLQSRIAKTEAKLASLEKKALSTGGLPEGAGMDSREEWENKTNGEKWMPPKTGKAVSFAGVQADSEVVKGAGCSGTVEEELARLGLSEN